MNFVKDFLNITFAKANPQLNLKNRKKIKKIYKFFVDEYLSNILRQILHYVAMDPKYLTLVPKEDQNKISLKFAPVSIKCGLLLDYHVALL